MELLKSALGVLKGVWAPSSSADFSLFVDAGACDVWLRPELLVIYIYWRDWSKSVQVVLYYDWKYFALQYMGPSQMLTLK